MSCDIEVLREIEQASQQDHVSSPDTETDSDSGESFTTASPRWSEEEDSNIDFEAEPEPFKKSDKGKVPQVNDPRKYPHRIKLENQCNRSGIFQG